ncbi:MAG: hypothetical protein JW952_02835, partial [Candidatus Eisenbacteria bacterium]|nr:hypothetical protein [Candidatus Eisenbacteria bacterium]
MARVEQTAPQTPFMPETPPHGLTRTMPASPESQHHHGAPDRAGRSSGPSRSGSQAAGDSRDVEVCFSENALKVLERRYLRKDEAGRIV